MSLFDKIKVRKPKYSTFDMSHEKKFSFKMGGLYPTFLQEVIPGDVWRVNSSIMLRMAPMLAPIMHRVNVYTHYFFVPNRIIWDNFQEFITGGEDGLSAPVWPYITYDNEPGYYEKGQLADFLGIPPLNGKVPAGGANGFSQLPFRAYQSIFNEYYRDQDLVTKVDFPTGDGLYTGNIGDLASLRQRAWEKDYFTSARPWAQKGAEVDLPLDVEYTPQYLQTATSVRNSNLPATGNLGTDATGNVQLDGENADIRNLEPTQDISGSFTINDFRKANRLQQWLERNARGGSRYVEQIFSHFGIISDDLRQMRPAYLGGGKQAVTLSEVLNHTGPAEGGTSTLDPGGQMYGHGISVGSTNKFKRRFKEHGFIMGITSVIPKTAYQDGLHRMYQRSDKFDYFYPEFANLGEQEIKAGEIYLDPEQGDSVNTATWGYQSRYSEYKYACSTVHGDFRDNLDFWHMGRKFDSAPALNDEFVKSDPTDRIFAVQDGTDTLWAQIYHDVKATRPMPYYGTPIL